MTALEGHRLVGSPSVPHRGCKIFGGGELIHWPSFFSRRNTHIHTYLIGRGHNYLLLFLFVSLLLLPPMLMNCMDLAEL